MTGTITEGGGMSGYLEVSKFFTVAMEFFLNYTHFDMIWGTF